MGLEYSQIIFEQVSNFPKITLKGIEAGNLEFAIDISNNAKALAPFDLGQLRNSIQYLTGTGEKGGLNEDNGDRAEEMSVTLKPDEAAVMASADYALYQELGTRYQAPQPFLRPAVAIAKGQDVDKVLKAIDREIARGVLTGNKKREKFI